MEVVNFDKGFESDDEMTEALDRAASEIARAVADDEAKESVAVPERVEQVGVVYKTMRRIIRGEDISVTYELHEPYPSMGSVSVVGKDIEIESPARFAQAALLASNIEVYPKTDGTVQMNLTFHNLTRKVGN